MMTEIHRWECSQHGDTACFDAAANSPGWCMECEGPVVSVKYVRSYRVEEAEKAAGELARALRLTQEYIGGVMLPLEPGRVWFDALQAYGHYENQE